MSRCKFPHLYRAEEVAKKLGAENRGKMGETLTFAEQQERKAERAEARAERMEYRSERAEKARRTAAEAKAPTDKSFCERRIADAEKTIRAQKKNLESYRRTLEKLNSGEQIKCGYGGDLLSVGQVEGWIENAEEIMENAMSKVIYYRDALESLGGVQFNRENVKPGYIVKFKHWGREHIGEVLSCGKKNLYIKDFVKISFADITEIVEQREPKQEQHPFKAGDTFTPELWNNETCKREKTPVEIVKATEKSVTVKNLNTGKTCVRKPQKRSGACYEGGYIWSFFLTEDYYSGCFKTANV